MQTKIITSTPHLCNGPRRNRLLFKLPILLFKILDDDDAMLDDGCDSSVFGLNSKFE